VPLDSEEINDLVDTLTMYVRNELFKANARNELEKAIDKFGLREKYEGEKPSYCYVDSTSARILVLAFSFHSVDDLKKAAKYYGIDPQRIDFQEFKSSFNYGTLEYSARYSDVIIGPVPHKGVNIGDASSFLAAVEAHPENYPKVQRMTDSSGNLKVSKHGFEECLMKTKFYSDKMNS
jgi:hypothetical protein